MRLTDFELQTQSGQLWLDIVERIAAKDAQITTLGAEIERLKAGLPDVVETPATPLVDQLAAYVVQLPTTPELETARAEIASLIQ